MSVDVACLGAPFLDLIFRGLASVPGPGEERGAEQLVVVPGAIANVAYALRQLGLDAVVCAPVGTDPAGRLLRDLMADAGIPWHGSPSPATPVTVSLPTGGDRALVTSTPPTAVEPDIVAGLRPRAVVTDLPNVPAIPPGPIVYAVAGEPEVTEMAGRLPTTLGHVRAVMANEREASILTGEGDAAACARSIAARGTIAVITRGASGACAASQAGGLIEAPAAALDVPDPTGAGDLFAAAFVWADLAGRTLRQCVELAVRYASLSLSAGAVGQKGLSAEEFERAG